ncbi:PhzF family phenazine biosynthesis protein [Lignipirellula cremea]|uniref:Putative isomerase YddE n=1 Tax=Lignipirellula cremea TaxID=2528010 RepID=A0A518DRF8_9BACT|nr:PhzF family phenazine biosynthesis protein [Lignipirellula cremea]QDU94425.1 putative isomerase YddE [Lignipirellula cremea]
MTARLLQIDAFTSRLFGGNPAAVCLLETDPTDAWMQAVAAENNLAETAYVQRRADGFSLRWFTPSTEVDLCGHATLAAAHALWTEGDVPPGEPIRFSTRSGWLTATRLGGESGDTIELDFPATPVQPGPPPPELLAGLGIETAVLTGLTRFDAFLELESADAVRALEPDFRRLGRIPLRGIIVTSRSDDEAYDFISRFFGPASGIDEDPATGSAYCALGPYWRERMGKQQLVGYQASRRGGVIRCRPEGDRVFLGGQAVTYFRTQLTPDVLNS